MIGRTLGPYQLIERLEGVGLHETYRAIDPRRFGQAVAVTVAALPPDDPEFPQRFERAAERLTELRHPNLLPLLDFGEADGQVFLVAPYLEGPTLAALGGRPRRPAEALGLLATIGDALDFAHRAEVAHGELTPEAIQLVNLPPGEDTLYAAWPLVLNVGYAGLIGPNALVGSIADTYRPPEDFDEPSAQADCYALAGVLHLLLTGVPPVAGGDATALATIGDGYATVLRRALSAAPGERYASCPNLLVALRDAATAERRNDDSAAFALLEDARTAVAAGKFRAASEAYGSYLRLRPQDELARREFATIESRRAELARRRAAASAASAAAALAAASKPPPPSAESVGEAAQPPSPEHEAAPNGADAPSPPVSAHPTPPGATQRVKLATGPLVVPPKPGGASSSTSSGPPRTFDPLVSPARDRRRAILPGVIAALLLLLAVIVAGTIMARRANSRGDDGAGTPGAGAAAIASPSRSGATGSARPVATSIPNSIPVAPVIPTATLTPVPTVPPLPPVITDPFDNHASGFPTVPGGREGSGYQNGEYVLVVPDPDAFEIAELGGCPINGNCTFGDFQAEVEAWAVGPTAGGSYGLVFHRQFANAYIQYFVLINPETGEFRLIRWVDTERFEVVKPTAHPAIARGEGKNRLVVATKGTLITIQINGVEVARVNDPGPTIGAVGLRADAGAGPITVRFDNFIIRPVR